MVEFCFPQLLPLLNRGSRYYAAKLGNYNQDWGFFLGRGVGGVMLCVGGVGGGRGGVVVGDGFFFLLRW